MGCCQYYSTNKTNIINLLQRLFGKKKKPVIPERVPPTLIRRSTIPMPTGISGRSLGSSSNTEEDDYYRRRQQNLYNFMIPDDPAPATSHESGSDFGGFGGGDTGGGGASGSWDSGSIDSGGSYDSGSSDSGSSDSGGGSSD